MPIRNAISSPNHESRRTGLGPRAVILGTSALLGIVLLASPLLSPAYAKKNRPEKPREAEFKYAGGTENLPEGCSGRLELGQSTLTFRCAQYSLDIPYSSITLMQYRPGISKQVRKLKLKWKVRPSGGGGKHNRYFTVLYTEARATHVAVLDVAPDAMRPYLAEIDLKAGRRVEVMGYEQFD